MPLGWRRGFFLAQKHTFEGCSARGIYPATRICAEACHGGEQGRGRIWYGIQKDNLMDSIQYAAASSGISQISVFWMASHHPSGGLPHEAVKSTLALAWPWPIVPERHDGRLHVFFRLSSRRVREPIMVLVYYTRNPELGIRQEEAYSVKLSDIPAEPEGMDRLQQIPFSAGDLLDWG